MRAMAVVSGLVLGVVSWAAVLSAGEYTVVRTGNSQFKTIGDGATVVTLETLSYKPNYGWMGISKPTITNTSKGDTLAYDQEKGTLKWTLDIKSQGNKLVAGVSVSATSDFDLTYLAFTFAPGNALGDGKVRVRKEDGSSFEVAIPIQPNEPKSVTGVDFLDAQGIERAKIDFAKPATLHMHYNVRVKLADKKIAGGETVSNTFTVDYGRPVTFYSDASRFPTQTDYTGWFAFQPKNTADAGAIGMADWLTLPSQPVQMNGDSLIADGKPFKVWGTNVEYSATAPSKLSAETRAAFFAKFGINGVRLHKLTNPGWEGLGSKIGASVYDPDALKRFDYFVHELRRHGITYGLSPIWDLKIFPGDREKLVAYDEIAKASNAPTTTGLVWFAKDVQDLHIETMLNLLNHKNENTGLRYAEDPALTYVEIQNEEDVFFYTTIPAVNKYPTYKKMVAEQFSDWLKKKYGSQQRLARAWGGGLNTFRHEGGFPDENLDSRNIFPVSNPWFWDNQGKDNVRAKRLQDTARFLFECQQNYYRRMTQAVREAGFKGPIVGSNWQAGSSTGHFLNLMSDAQIGMIDRHNYMGGAQGNPAHEMNSGHALANHTMLGEPGSALLSVGMQQAKDRPFVFSEWLAVPPVEWAAADTTIIAAYGFGLQDWDMSYHFASNGDGFSARLQNPGKKKFNNLTPVGVGLNPILSRMILRGDVEPGKVIATRRVSFDQAVEQTYDFENKSVQQHDVKSFSGTPHHNALAAGRVLVEFTDAAVTSTIDDWAATYKQNNTIVSSTKQLRWTVNPDAKSSGYISINTAGTQGVAGFVGGQLLVLGDLALRMKSPYAVILATAKSQDETLATDKEVLVAAIARVHNSKMNMGSGMIFSAGEAPMILEPVRAKLYFRRKAGTVTVLDHDGIPTATTFPLKGGTFELDTARDKTMYYLVTFE